MFEGGIYITIHKFGSYAACASRERFAVDRPLRRAWAIATPHPTPSVDGHAPVSRLRPVARPSPATRGKGMDTPAPRATDSRAIRRRLARPADAPPPEALP